MQRLPVGKVFTQLEIASPDRVISKVEPGRTSETSLTGSRGVIIPRVGMPGGLTRSAVCWKNLEIRAIAVLRKQRILVFKTVQ